MKATLDIPDELYRRVKARSAMEGRPIRSVAVKISRRLILPIAISAIVFPGVVAIALMPSSAEGVYNPLSVSSTMGCDCDQFVEIRDGRILFHVMEGTESFLNGSYKRDSSGSIIFTNEDGMPFMRVEPHLLGSRFYYPDTAKSEWRWRRFVTRNMKDHMGRVNIKDIVREKDGLRFITYDHDFRILNTKLYPKPPARPTVSP